MAEILGPHEGALTHASFNAAEARAKFALEAGLPEAAAQQHTEAGVSIEVAAAVVNKEGQVSDIQPVGLEEEGGQSFIPPVDAVEDKLKVEGLMREGEQVVIFDLDKDKELLKGKFVVTPKKYGDLPLVQ